MECIPVTRVSTVVGGGPPSIQIFMFIAVVTAMAAPTPRAPLITKHLVNSSFVQPQIMSMSIIFVSFLPVNQSPPLVNQ